MSGLSAVIFLPDDTAKTGYDAPLLLQPVMGIPLLSWLVDSLSAGGVERFFLICRPQHRDSAAVCFPDEVELTCPQDHQVAFQLGEFLARQGEDEDVIVVTGPCVLLPYAPDESQLYGTPTESNMVCISRKSLARALDGDMQVLDCLREYGMAYTDRDGAYAVTDAAELPDWQPILSRARLSRMAAAGVKIWDYANTYVTPGVTVASGTQLLPGTILQGKTAVGADCVIGPNSRLADAEIGEGTEINASQVLQARVGSFCRVGPYAAVRTGSVLGDRTAVGSFSQLRQVQTGTGVTVSALCHLNHAVLGDNAVVEAGAVTGQEEGTVTVEEKAYVGANVTLAAAMSVGSEACVEAGSAVSEDIPAMAVAVARARAAVRKDWSGKNKS